MTIRTYLVQIDTNAENEPQLQRVDFALCLNIHHGFPLCPTDSSPEQRGHVYLVDPSFGVFDNTDALTEIKYDPILADHEEPPDYVSPVGVDPLRAGLFPPEKKP